MKILLIISIIFISFSLFAEVLNYDKVITNLKGIKEFEKENFTDSEKEFSKNSINHPRDGRLHFNLGNSHYKNGKLEDAENDYNLALKDKDFTNKSSISHTLGNVKFQQQDYKNAIVNYRNSLIENPENNDARHNYELTARMLERQQQQQQQQENQQDQENQKKNEEQQNQQQDQKEKQEQQDKKQEQKEEQKENQEQKKQQQMKKDQKKEDAEKMLNALLAKEKEEMKKEKMKMNVDKAKKGKYW